MVFMRGGATGNLYVALSDYPYEMAGILRDKGKLGERGR